MAKIRTASIDDMEQVFLLACDFATSFKVEKSQVRQTIPSKALRIKDR